MHLYLYILHISRTYRIYLGISSISYRRLLNLAIVDYEVERDYSVLVISFATSIEYARTKYSIYRDFSIAFL